MSDVAQELWTIQEAAEWLRITPQSVRTRLSRAQFPKETYTRVGKLIRFIVPRLKEWILTQAA